MRTKHCSVFLVIALALAAISSFPAFSQEAPADWYYGKAIRTVSFEGLKNVKSSDLEGITSGFIGKPFSDEVYEDILNRTFALDYFENLKDIRVTPADGTFETCRSIDVILVVEEYPVITRIRFTGYHQIRLADLKDAISSAEKSVYNEAKRFMDERALRDLYIEKGFTEIKISSKAEQNADGYIVTYEINEGQKTVVKEITFTGNTVVSAATLKGKLSLKEVGLFQKGSFQESQLEQDSKAIVAYYKDHGYVDARVVNYTVDTAYNEEKNRRELTICFNIQEGSKYMFSGVTFEGNKVFSTEELSALVRQKPGETYNETRYQETAMAVQFKYYDNGYTSNQFQSQMVKDSDAKTIGYNIVIQENSRSHIENIIIRGNTKTKDEVITREIPVESGDIFSSAKINTALRNLYNLQYFSPNSIYPEVSPGSEEDLIDIVFNVEEQSTTSIEFGLNFSGVNDPDQFPISLYAKLQDSNLFGTGRTASIGLNLATTDQSVSLGYGQNWMFGLPISTSLSLSYSHSTNNDLRSYVTPDGEVNNGFYMEYESHEFNFTASLGHRWTPDWAILTLTGGLSSSLINNVYDSSIYTPYSTTVSNYNAKFEPKNSLFAAFSMDGRNINYDPTDGWFVSQRLGWYGLVPREMFGGQWGETEFYLRTDTKAERYFTLVNHPFSEKWSLQLILMLYSGLSFQFPVEGTAIKQSNQLYMDGRFNARGWTMTGTSAGYGRALWNNTVELRMPVVPGILAVDLFFDASVLKKTPGDFFTDLFNSNDWYFSYGPSVRFCIQQFPLRLLFVNTFQIKDGQFVCETATGDPTTWAGAWHFVLSFNITNR
ncbi:MAG TPA: outer membrane protein assembly factor BamA [Treponema sp.]|nr:outer membrane protein assembly factor BamA [Treponema sp.]HCA20273.1 outer membrane protein assembly factor BamA [Treponema sp.]